MGVRLTILDEEDNILFYGSKLYGYEDLENSKSAKYLWDIKSEFLINERNFKDFDDFASCMEIEGCDKVCKLSIAELKEFLRLYDEDLKMYQKNYTISDSVWKEIPDDVKYVWLEWG